VTADILAFMSALDTREIQGYLPEFGYRVFTDTALHSGPSPAASPPNGTGPRN
jgi:arginine decarboxylase